MHDIKWIRENLEAFVAALARRGLDAQSAELLGYDEQRRRELTELQEMQAKRNEIAKHIPEVKKAGGDIAPLMAEANAVKLRIAELETGGEATRSLDDALSRIPNLLAADVPEGADETGNFRLARLG